MSDTPPATPLAREIHAKFLRKMAPGGEIDQILNGGSGAPKREALPSAEVEMLKHQIGVQMAEYEEAIAIAVAWWRGWKDRRPKGFRAVKRQAKDAKC